MLRLKLKNQPLQANMLIGIISLLVFTVVSILFYSYTYNARSMADLSADFISQVNDTVLEKTNEFLIPSSKMVAYLSEIPFKSLTDLEPYLLSAARNFSSSEAFFYGDESGDFVFLRLLPDGGHTTRFVLPTRQETIYQTYDKSGVLVSKKVESQANYDPRVRPWYLGAKSNKSLSWSDIYIFFSSQAPGITVSYPVLQDGHLKGVFGADIRLSGISHFLADLKVGTHGIAFIMDKKQRVIAYPKLSETVIRINDTFRTVFVNELSNSSAVDAVGYFNQFNQEQFVFKSQGEAYISAVSKFPETFQKEWSIVVVVPESDFMGQIKKTNRIIILSSIAILFVAILFSLRISRSISEPIQQITDETKRIQNFDLENKLNLKTTILEIHQMSDAIEAMKSGLKSFQKYVPSELVRQLIKSGVEPKLGGDKRELSVMFTDIEGFTALAEDQEPEQLMIHLSHYLDEMTKIIRQNTGTIDKYIGDSIMSFWGAPIELENHAFFACKTALECRDRLLILNEEWFEKGLPTFRTRFGINTGKMVVGNMGSNERMNYSVLGDEVNLGSRLEGINKEYGTEIMISQRTYTLVKSDFICCPVDIVAVKGKSKGVKIYELLAVDTPENRDRYEEFISLFTQGFRAYAGMDFETAMSLFKQCKKLRDVIYIELYLKRCRDFLRTPPGDDWDGIYVATSK